MPVNLPPVPVERGDEIPLELLVEPLGRRRVSHSTKDAVRKVRRPGPAVAPLHPGRAVQDPVMKRDLPPADDLVDDEAALSARPNVAIPERGRDSPESLVAVLATVDNRLRLHLAVANLAVPNLLPPWVLQWLVATCACGVHCG